MPDLIAQGPEPGDTWRRPLPAGQPLVLGRDAGAWDVPWERFLSRRHVELIWRDGRLEVRQLPAAGNPLFLRGREVTRCRLAPGEHFVLGTTSFRVADQAASPAAGAPGLLEATVSAPDLQRLGFRDAPHRLDVLRRLPEVIAGAANDAELFPRLTSMLLAGIPRADVVALVSLAGPPDGAEAPVDVLHWERRLATGGPFEPSQRLVREALDQRRQTVLHVWGGPGGAGLAAELTPEGDYDWAYCSPVGGQPWLGWGLYVAGRFPADRVATLRGPLESSDLADDLKFTELVGDVFSALRQVRSLQRKQASLSQFFSPAVLGTLVHGDPEVVLRPREADLTILFSDLRGFSRQAERHAEQLLALLNRVSQALGVMTQNILDQKGVIGDFHGDAAMGFWGWPMPQPDAVERACLAALSVRTFFEAIGRKPGHPLAGFEVGIGIASGRAVAGKIGTVNQVKVTVFGPVVNLASRLEGMTKILRVPILLDEVTAGLLRGRGLWHLARWRRLARVRPYGLETPLTVTELLPPAGECPELTDAHLADYESALDAFLAGDWDTAYDLLRRMPPHDRAPDFLTGFIVKHDRQAPPGWDGVIELDSKR
jgi:adenylate cyclase